MVTAHEKVYFKMLRTEALTIYNMQKHWKNRDGSIYVPLENAKINWFFNPKEVGHFDDLWKEGLSIKKIAKAMNRPVLEVVLLLMDRDYQGKIKPREGGIWGP